MSEKILGNLAIMRLKYIVIAFLFYFSSNLALKADDYAKAFEALERDDYERAIFSKCLCEQWRQRRTI